MAVRHTSDVGRHALELATRIAALPEVDMRRAALAEWLARLAPEVAAPWLAEIVRRGSEGGPPYGRALGALLLLFTHPAPLGYDELAAIYRAARTLGHDELADLFLSNATADGGNAPRGTIVEANNGRQLTLGERKALARRSTQDQIARLARDPDPSVIRQLLLNPKLTERDVLAMASRRPTTAAAQTLIAESRRFATSYAVRRALVFNPHTPSDLATRLLPLLQRRDLREVAHENTLPAAVRDLAKRLAKGRDARSGGDS